MTLSGILLPAAEKAIDTLYGIAGYRVDFQSTRKDFAGDTTIVLFPLVKLLKSSPAQIGEQLGNYLVAHVEEVSSFNVVSGFLNIVIADSYYQRFFAQIRNNPDFAFRNVNSNDKSVIVEYS